MEIINYPNYLIYDDGRVFSKTSNRFLKPTVGNDGYSRIGLYNIKCKKFLLHRLIAMHYIPNLENNPEVDHIDGNKLNNFIENLRWASTSQNAMNKRKQTRNKSGLKGVSFNKKTQKWTSFICRIYLGEYPTAEEASAVYEAKAKEVFGDFYREIV